MFDTLFGGTSFEAAHIPEQKGRVILVTGGNIGLGQETCLQLAKHSPAQIYLAARNESKARDAIDGIKEASPQANVEFLELDLGDFESIKKAAKTVDTKTKRLDILINNAGVMALPPALTKSGYEVQFGTNHMGHALLTKLLMPILQRTAKEQDSDVRIVNLTSLGHTFAPSGGLVLDEDKTDLAAHSTWRRYGQSKLANILFTHELARRYPEITSVAIHPGAVQTNLANGILQNSSLLVVPHWIVMKLFANTVQQGALNQLWAATAEGVESGAYYVPVGKKNPGSVYAQDEKLSNKLWEWTENEFSKKGI